jgi:PhnB protein
MYEAARKIARLTSGFTGRPGARFDSVEDLPRPDKLFLTDFIDYVTYRNIYMSIHATPSLAPYICTGNAAAAIKFYCTAFAATEKFRLTDPSGKIGHAELRFGEMALMLSDEFPDFGARSPSSIGGSPVSLLLYVADVDAVVARAIAAGATILRPIVNEFYGDRVGMVMDPFGHKWHIATRIEEVTPAEMQSRMDKMYA